ncbi:MAG: calcineurin-like phosphoesterase family protein, partial [Bacteroidota bacterium]
SQGRLYRIALSAMLSRRSFVKRSLAASAALAFPAPFARALAAPRRLRPVRIEGVVRADGRGLGGVAISDGMQVVETAADGTFSLIADPSRTHVFMSTPAGYEIPTNETGTARFYEPITQVGEEQTATFDLTPLAQSDDHHAVIAWADTQTQDSYETGLLHAQTVPDVQALVAALDMPAVGITVGDIMFDDLALFPEYERAVQRIGVPFFQVVGNHDILFEAMTDEASTATFESHFGPRYYSFDRGAVHHVVLDDVFWSSKQYAGYLDADQLAWLEADLARIEPGGPVIVYQHIPALGSRHVRTERERPNPGMVVLNREALYRLLEPFDAHIVCGHTHESEHVFEGGVHEHTIAAVSGAWWSGPICYDGTPNGYKVFEARGEEVRWRYKPTGGSFDDQLRVYTPGSDAERPGTLIANVWDWDPDWTVVWHEGSDQRGELTPGLGLDPLSVRLHAGDELPIRENRRWVDPVPTHHLLSTMPGDADLSRVTVEATDRFGRTYTALPSTVDEHLAAFAEE